MTDFGTLNWAILGAYVLGNIMLGFLPEQEGALSQ